MGKSDVLPLNAWPALEKTKLNKSQTCDNLTQIFIFFTFDQFGRPLVPQTGGSFINLFLSVTDGDILYIVLLILYLWHYWNQQCKLTHLKVAGGWGVGHKTSSNHAECRRFESADGKHIFLSQHSIRVSVVIDLQALVPDVPGSNLNGVLYQKYFVLWHNKNPCTAYFMLQLKSRNFQPTLGCLGYIHTGRSRNRPWVLVLRMVLG